MGKRKVYAVRIGRERGIYHSWADCKLQVEGYPGAIFKGFFSLEEAEAFLQDKGQGEEPELLKGWVIYVDGSYKNGEYSWGFAVYKEGKLYFSKNGRGGSREDSKMHNVAGELEATEQAILWAMEEKIDQLILCHDYTGIANWATGAWKANLEQTRAYKKFMDGIGLQVHFHKVKGHTGVEGNERADELAKMALEGRLIASYEKSDN